MVTTIRYADGGGGGAIELTGDVTGNSTSPVATTLASTGVTAGTYSAANITVNAKGLVTFAASSGGAAATPSDFKESVDLATTANITLSGEQTIDGTLTSASRVLVKNQTTASANGIYTTGAGAWTRTTDADTSAEMTSGTYIFVEGGTVSAGLVYALITPDPITLGTTSLSFVSIQLPFSASVNRTLSNTTYTHVLTDSGKRINFTSASTKTVTIAPNASVASAINTEIEIFNVGAGTLTLAPGSGVTLNSFQGDLTLGQYEYAKLKKRLTNTWDITGIQSASAASTVGKQTIPVQAGSMIPAVTNGCSALYYYEQSNGAMTPTLYFDPSTVEYAHFSIVAPKKWNAGTVTVQFRWWDSTGSSDAVVWGVAGYCVTDNSAMSSGSPLWGTAQTVTDSNGGGANYMLISAETPAMTFPAASKGGTCFFRIYRNATDGADTLAVDAGLLSVDVHFTTDAGTDA